MSSKLPKLMSVEERDQFLKDFFGIDVVSIEKRGSYIARHFTKEGYVYLIQSPSSLFKIGRAKTPENRLHTFSVKLPFEVVYIALVKTNDMIKLERDLHVKFASKRINGEWFALTPDDVNYIKGLES
jgi:hypothetical protein